MQENNLIEILEGNVIDSTVNFPKMSIYNIPYSSDPKILVRTIYEAGKRDGMVELKEQIKRRIGL